MGQLVRMIREHFVKTITTTTYYDFETDPVPPNETWYIDAVAVELETDAPSEVRLGIRSAGYVIWACSDTAPTANELSSFSPRFNLREGETLVIRIYTNSTAKEANAYVLGKGFMA